MLRAFVPHFPPNSEGIACGVAELNVALFPRHQSEEIKINLNNILFPRVGIEPMTDRIYRRILCPCATTGLSKINTVLYPLRILHKRKTDCTEKLN